MESGMIIGAFGYIESPTDESMVLMIKRKNDPYAGYFSFPGGGVEDGESLMEAAIREVKEETNVDVDPSTVLLIGNIKFYGDHDSSKLYKANIFKCDYLRGKLKPGYDTEEVFWQRHEDIPGMKVPAPVKEFYKKMMKDSPRVTPIELNIAGR